MSERPSTIAVSAPDLSELEERYALEIELVSRSITYARDHLGLGA